jgi:hypothetical protein
MYRFLHIVSTFGKQCLLFGAIAFTYALNAQAPAVFNFENATKVSELPEPVAVSNSAPPSMQKRYYLDPTQQLFTAAELKEAYTQMANLRVFYGMNHNASSLWEKTRDLLFSDKATTSAKCDDLSATLLAGAKPSSNTDYKNKLVDVMGVALYADLQFCLNYLGLQYSDWELWQAYIADRAALVKEIKNLPALSNRLMAFILAVDVQYTLCSQQNPNVACLMPSVLPKKDSK